MFLRKDLSVNAIWNWVQVDCDWQLRESVVYDYLCGGGRAAAAAAAQFHQRPAAAPGSHTVTSQKSHVRPIRARNTAAGHKRPTCLLTHNPGPQC